MNLQSWPWAKIRKIAIIVGIVFVAICIVICSLRTPILKHLISGKVESFNQTHNADVRIEHPHFSGILTLNIDKISVKAIDQDTLVAIDGMKVKINPLKILIGRLSISKFIADRLSINILRDSVGSNYSFLFKSKNKPDSEETTSTSYSSRVDHIINLFFDILPDDINISQFSIKANSKGHQLLATIPNFKIDDGEIDLETDIYEDNIASILRLRGEINSWSNSAMLRVFADNGKASIPFINYKYNANVEFDTLAFGIDKAGYHHGDYQMKGVAMFNGLTVQHKRISAGPMSLEKGKVDYVLNFGRDYIELDSASTVSFNRISFNPYAKFKNKPKRFVAISLNKDYFPAQDLFSSLPEGIFSTFKGLEVTGDFAYHLKFEADWQCLDSLIFESELKERNFKITKYGEVAYPYINGPFRYTFYDNGVPVRTFVVGDENPNFRHLDQIPKWLQYSVMFSEDGDFFWHKGFLIDAFRSSMIRNIKAGRFVRGGSTISMQLVKNIYLSRNKTVARKVEEALITWIIEHQHLVSKQRMLEIYLNVIEWGPGVFGANEAAQFYFDKSLSQITPSEAIYMASIIPRPKKFYYSFSDSGSLRPSLHGYFSNIAGKLLRHGIITQEQHDQIYPSVNIDGFAKVYLQTPVEDPVDTLLLPDAEPFIIDNTEEESK